MRVVHIQRHVIKDRDTHARHIRERRYTYMLIKYMLKK